MAATLGRSVLVGLIGRGTALSRTPLMHEAEGARQGLRYVYRRIDPAEMAATPSFEEMLRAAEICGYAGVNVTHPYKQEAVSYLDDMSEEARAVGAVNTIVLKDGRRVGHNTDLSGFAESFRRSMGGEPKGRVLLIGAGGAGSAVAHALLDSGVGTLLIADTNRAGAEKLVAALEGRFGRGRAAVAPSAEAAAPDADGIVNATPIGMADHPGMPLPVSLLDGRHWVIDIIYFPMETAFVRAAKAAGCRTATGAGMALFQAVKAFELFTGLPADPEAMRATFDSFGAE
ncbi:shikimate dehydrogenase [Thalassobaculum sp. OXR-137]|uniref:shikimate dehydrogenase n=1 Tax=Thalassobaculum sp. OXR-137 TaxID=3100173 RepID=UPI002AC915FA|nr:shikimate dehydrogenase [Thalassobaculum sp. OXR-137]WPZ36334.1 shikimate dehydrogenase [Thalassobaculum sp. OXR-137]